jgi:hypothetical protein
MDEKLITPEEVKQHPAWLRLEDQSKWYSQKSTFNQKRYRELKLVQIVLAASIPILALVDTEYTKFIVAIFGAMIAVVEGIQQLFQFHTLWTEYRSTAEKLKREKFLFLSLSGPYRKLNQDVALLLLAERIEEHMSTEQARWIEVSKKTISEVSPVKKTV